MKSKVFLAPVMDGAAVTQQVEALQKLYTAGELNQVVAKRDFVAIKFYPSF